MYSNGRSLLTIEGQRFVNILIEDEHNEEALKKLQEARILCNESEEKHDTWYRSCSSIHNDTISYIYNLIDWNIKSISLKLGKTAVNKCHISREADSRFWPAGGTKGQAENH